MTTETDERRAAALKASLGSLQLPPRAPELRLLHRLHRWLDSWRGVGDIVNGMRRLGYETEFRQYPRRAGACGFRLSGRLNVGRLLRAEVLRVIEATTSDESNSPTVVAPTGFEPVLSRAALSPALSATWAVFST